ncbi:MAG: anhydro-N-acetylmuramic acid kinase [Bacteroidales bacterium]|jgi:anhydro-N-acetylmuramic acid kinase|nr:anhydro-N-acetylmuramic acid kinase [Bacteroidales bacterium]
MDQSNTKITAVGLMSGSSLDGLDLAAVEFWQENGRWFYEIKKTAFYAYAEKWQQKLERAFYLKSQDLNALDKEYGQYLGELTNAFIQQNQLNPLLVASHGHTVFHQPEKGVTFQIGNGQALADACKCFVISDFRSEDVRKGGQGAPLVPIGDRLLFADYELCLNIGGIANISFEDNNKRLAFDCCIANQGLNYIAGFAGLPYDEGGKLAASGTFIPALFEALNTEKYFIKRPPKSLGREFFEKHQRELLLQWQHNPADAAHTYCVHIAHQISQAVAHLPKGKMLVTGGGAFHKFLIDKLKQSNKHEVELASEQLINYKEALIFAFLGVLKQQGKINILADYTGASSDSSSGVCWYPQ